MSKSYEKVSTDFIQAVQQMQQDLQYLATQKTFKASFFDKQNRILAALIEYHKRTKAYVQILESDLLEQQLASSVQSKRYENRIVCFEAICIIHGIMDFPLLLKKGKTLLLKEATELGKQRKMKLPDLLQEKIKAMSPEAKTQVEKLLFAKTNAEITALLKKINLKTAEKYGFRTQRYTTKLQHHRSERQQSQSKTQAPKNSHK